MRLAIAGGGTGGHLYPGLALADLAEREGVATHIVFFGAERGIEARVVPAHGYELVAQPLEGLRGRGAAAAVRALARLISSVGRARRELRLREIDVVVGLGGYASSAAVVAARLAGVPVVLLEQNRDPGLSNRLLARVAAAVCTSFAETERAIPHGRAHLTGNPVRAELEALSAADRDTLLVFGGSAGAASLNRAVVVALSRVAASTKLPPIVHQAGRSGAAEVRAGYEKAGIAADVREFIDDMGAVYARTRLAVCRAGATSVAELVATATPAILVPYPHATGDHQTANGRALEAAGAAIVVPDDAQTEEVLTKELTRLLLDRDGLDSMATAAASLRRPGAVRRVLDVVQGVAAGNR